MTAAGGEPSTVRPMTNSPRPTPPANLTVTLARQLALRSEVVPTALLLAACAVLRAASREVLAEPCAHPRRPGNPAERLQALSDARTADHVEEGLELRLAVLHQLDAAVTSGEIQGSAWARTEDAQFDWPMAAARQCGEVEHMPALGPN
jgi:hypothetical protein